jgi:cyclase
MKLHVGNHTFEMIPMPGHTAYQTAICVKEEGVVFTSDNIFCKCHTWLQEAQPDLWLVALENLRKLDEEVFVPGHGPICGKDYLPEQAAFIEEWKAYVQKAIERGMTKDEAIEKLTDLTDRYPMDVGQDGMAPGVMKRNVANLYDYFTGQQVWPA